jgi:pyrroloquinoline quinone (PQQ) biosynthesis protein C
MPVTTEAKPMTASEFRSELLEAIVHARAEETRFYRLLISGRCPLPTLQAYAHATVGSADLFCETVGELLAKAPDDRAKLLLLENLMEEEGIFLRPSGGLVSRPETAHPALARRFAAALGVTEFPGGYRHATSAGRALLACGNWVEAVAHLLIGQELLFAETAPVIARGLVHCGLSQSDVAFFLVHEKVDRRHGEEALSMVIEHARSRAQQERCISEARAGANAWLEAHGGLVA